MNAQVQKIASSGKTVRMVFVWKISIHVQPFANQDIIVDFMDVNQFPSMSAELKETVKYGKTA